MNLPTITNAILNEISIYKIILLLTKTNLNMEQLQARILIKHVEGAEIAYLYNREAFDLLNIKLEDWDKSQFIEAGTSLEYDGKKYIVESVNFKMEPELYGTFNESGVNMYSPTDSMPHNCQIRVLVKNS